MNVTMSQDEHFIRIFTTSKHAHTLLGFSACVSNACDQMHQAKVLHIMKGDNIKSLNILFTHMKVHVQISNETHFYL